MLFEKENVTAVGEYQEECSGTQNLRPEPVAPHEPGLYRPAKLVEEDGFVSLIEFESVSTVYGSAAFRRYQNIVLLLAEVSGTICSTSQCSTTLPFSSKRKMLIPV